MQERFPRILVTSAMIRSVGYCPVRKWLEVEFHPSYYRPDKGLFVVYRFEGVEPPTVLEFVQTRSKGGFYFNNIRHRFRGFQVEYEMQIFRSPDPGETFKARPVGEKPDASDEWPDTPCGHPQNSKEWVSYWVSKNLSAVKSKFKPPPRELKKLEIKAFE